MSWLRKNREPSSSSARPRAAAEELFDEHFQKKLEYLALVSRRIFAGRTRAERRSRKAGAGVEFADYREYFPGDDYRQVDWNVYGRSDRLMLRLHEQEEDLSVYLLLDCSGSMAFGSPRKLDYAKQICAALAYVALNHLDRVSITALRHTALERLPPTRGRNRIFTVFDFLRPLPASGTTDLADGIGSFVAQNKRRGVAILISDLYDPAGFEQAINQLRYARFETHVVHVTDAADVTPRLSGDVELVDAETGATRQATLTPRLLQRYRQAYDAYLARVASFCVQKRVGLFSVDTGTPPEQAMLRILRRGGLVA
jgi:uncharacterized protein (DUF58 family)